MEWGCLAFYIAEMALKLLALGAVSWRTVPHVVLLAPAAQQVHALPPVRCSSRLPLSPVLFMSCLYSRMGQAMRGLELVANGCLVCNGITPAAFDLGQQACPAAVQWADKPGAYFRSAWNWLDFVVVVTSGLAAVLAGAGWVSALRLLRVLRPLRLIARSKQMKARAGRACFLVTTGPV
jgi:hypothetical protein